MANIFDLFKQISSDSSSSGASKVEYIVAGLGNPGSEYSKTRHNAGFISIDYIAGRCGAKIDRAKFSALVGEAVIADKKVLLMKPQTFMNNSGEALAAAARFYKLSPEKIVVISDDISLDVGRVRVRRNGSHGGQNGLRSIEACLSSKEYPRVKVGIGAKPHPDYDLASWVLSSFSTEDIKAIEGCLPRIYEGVCKIVAGQLEEAMQICNGKQ